MSEIESIAAHLRGFTDAAKSDIAEVKARLAELESKAAVIRGSDPAASPATSRITMALLQSDEYKAFLAGKLRTAAVPMPGVSIKAALTSTALPGAGSPTSEYGAPRTTAQGIVGYSARTKRLLDALPHMQCATNVFEFNRLTSGYTNVAAEQTTEGALKAESHFPLELATATIATVAHWLPASKQVLADSPGLQATIQAVLMDGLADRLERLVVSGSGTISGLQTQGTAFAFTESYRVDCAAECAASMAEEGFEPTIVAMSPSDWAEQQVRKNSQLDYVLGQPNQAQPPTIFGLTVVASAACTDGRWLVIDPRSAIILDREAPRVEFGHVGDQFAQNLVSILAELRAGLAVLNPRGVRTMNFTGSPSPN